MLLNGCVHATQKKLEKILSIAERSRALIPPIRPILTSGMQHVNVMSPLGPSVRVHDPAQSSSNLPQTDDILVPPWPSPLETKITRKKNHSTSVSADEFALQRPFSMKRNLQFKFVRDNFQECRIKTCSQSSPSCSIEYLMCVYLLDVFESVRRAASKPCRRIRCSSRREGLHIRI